MSTYISKDEAAKAILDIGQRMYIKNFVAANDGNISVRIGDNEFLATPKGVSKGLMTEDMLVVVDCDGNVINGSRKPSSELKMHLRAYKENSAIKSVCHAHPPICTSFSIAGIELNSPILAEAVITLGNVPIAPYAELGTDEVANVIAPYTHTHNGIMLANHGVVTWADDPYAAYYRLESMEYYANIVMITDKILGNQNTLSKEQVDRLLSMRTKFGITQGGEPKCIK